MADILSKLFSTEVSAQEKVGVIADLLTKVLNYVLGLMDIEVEE